jgi:FkbM family methyltransferase
MHNSWHQLKRAVFRFNQKRIDGRIVRESQNDSDFFFVQVGSNDGVSGDPIHKFIVQYHWRGLLIEPIPYLYKKLMAVYAHQSNLFFERVAIDREPGEKHFYYIRSAGGSAKMAWYEKLGSFDKEHLVKHRAKIPDFDKRLVEATVPCVTLEMLFAKHRIAKINLLHIDAEGYDYEIIKTIPFSEIKPQMILYENKHLSQSDKAACKELLKSHGYKLIKGKDTFAYVP